jgi:hypothetical protein
MHKNHCVYEKAMSLLQNYFMIEEETEDGDLLKVIQGDGYKL